MTILNEGIEILVRNISARLLAKRNAIQNAATHPNKEIASRIKPLIKLSNAERAIIAGMTKSTQTIFIKIAPTSH